MLGSVYKNITVPFLSIGLLRINIEEEEIGKITIVIWIKSSFVIRILNLVIMHLGTSAMNIWF